jgi:DNA-binding beta-propeller fold protein YncE
MVLLAATLALLASADPPLETAAEAAAERPTVLDLKPSLLIAEFLYEGPFQRVTSVHCDPGTGEIYVADATQGVIGIFDERGAPLFAFSDAEHLAEPRRITVDSKGRIYALDLDWTHVKVFNYRGDFEESIDVAALAGQPVQLSALALDDEGLLWVGDSLNGQILAIGAGPRLLRRFGVPGNGPGELGGIASLAVDRERVYVADQTSLGVQVYSRFGRYQRGWGLHETGKANVSLPAGIAVDGAGRIILVDMLRHEIKYFEPDGKLIEVFGGIGRQPGDVSYPGDVSVGRGGVVCVAEKGNSRVQVFDPVVGVRQTKPADRPPREQRAGR